MAASLLRASFFVFCLVTFSVPAAEISPARVPRQPLAQWVADTDTALVDWSDVDHALAVSLPVSDLPLKIRLRIDGDRLVDIPAGNSSWKLTLERGEQHDVAVEFRSAKTGALIHRTESGLLEVTSAQTILRRSFDPWPLLQVHLPKADAARAGVNDDLARLVVDISREKVAWLLRPSAPASLRAIPPHLLDVTVQFDANGQPLSVEAVDRQHGVTLHPSIADFFIKMDAAFNGNSFFWDDMFISLEAAWHQPALAAATLDFWYAIQRENQGGVIPREVRKANRISYNPAQTVLLGKTRENGAYTNPNLSGWAEWQLFALRGRRGAARLDLSLHSLQAYLDWLKAKRSVAGEPIGLWQDNLGSGMDNLPRGGGQYAPDANAASIWVDLTAQSLAMYREIARMHAVLGEWSESAKAAAEVTRVTDYLNRQHWSDDGGFYFDRIPGARGALTLDTATSTIAGFWPLWAGAASAARTQQVAERQLVEGRFGGAFPLPALSESHPLYSDQGNYWQGGRWPNTASMAIQAFENEGRADVALDLTRKFLHGMSEVSDEYAATHARGTVYEFYGQERLPGGKIVARPGLEPGHLTREDFAGWAAVPPVYDMIRHWVGLRPVPGFAGPIGEKARWLEMLQGPLFLHTNFLRFHPNLAEASQRARAAEGYLEWNLVTDPGTDALEVRNIRFHDRGIEKLSLRRIGADRYRLAVKSEARFGLQLNRLFDPRRVSPVPLATSAIEEIGGDAREQVLEIPLTPASTNGVG